MNWIALFRLCIRVYPGEFRTRFGPEMEEVFEQGLAESRQRSRYLMLTFADALSGGIRERTAVSNPRSLIVLVGCLAVGILIGYADLQADEPQGTVLVVLLGGGLIGSVWRRGTLGNGLALALGIPGMYLISVFWGKGAVVGPGLVMIVPAMIGLACGTGVRKLLEGHGKGVVGFSLSVFAGFVFGVGGMLLGTPVVLVACSLFAGVGLGRSVPKRAYFWAVCMSASLLLTEAFMMSARSRSIGPWHPMQDFGISLLGIIGAAIGIRFADEKIACKS